jgi:hypothetical protein
MATKKQFAESLTAEQCETLFDLAERWMDERGHEDIDEYLTVIERQIPEAFAITKRPFGVNCKADDGNVKVDVLKNGNRLSIRTRYLA